MMANSSQYKNNQLHQVHAKLDVNFYEMSIHLSNYLINAATI